MLREVILPDVSPMVLRYSDKTSDYPKARPPTSDLIVLLLCHMLERTRQDQSMDWVWRLFSVEHGFKVAQQDLHRPGHVSVQKRRSSPSRACLMITLM
jgi:hypothetical protein